MHVTREDIDIWNKRMKHIQFSERHKSFREGEVWWCALGINIGTEQNGTGYGMKRPVLILKKLSSKNCYAVPLTTSSLKEKYRVDIGMIQNKHAKGLLNQIRLIDSKRLSEKITDIDPCMFLYIRETARDLF